MQHFLLAFHFVLAFAIVGLILLQKHDSDGALGSSGGGAGSSMFSVRGQANLLTRATAILMTIFIINCIILGRIHKHKVTEGSLIDNVDANTSAPISQSKPDAASEVPPQPNVDAKNAATVETASKSKNAATVETAPESKNTATEETASKSKNAATEETTPESKNAATEETAPESKNAATEETAPESKNTATEETAPESKNAATSDLSLGDSGTDDEEVAADSAWDTKSAQKKNKG
ncbi:MAG: preprotein translocase subunit SecG [Holosporaceae bacterium]|jgi:preprotein translocase subunit SecG|nr:preprotein translocase subunit SecG [Holosporaceae bacterium]